MKFKLMKAKRLALFASAIPSSVAAQSSPSLATGPIRQTLDSSWVDLATLSARPVLGSISIGSPSDGGFQITQAYGVPNQFDGGVTSVGNTYTVTVLGEAENFTRSGNTFTPVEKNGSILTVYAGGFTYQRHDGLSAYFDYRYATERYRYKDSNGNIVGISIAGTVTGGITLITLPSGESFSFNYTTREEKEPSSYPSTYRFTRLQSVRSNAGYHIKYTYVHDVPTGTLFGGDLLWWTRSKATLLNERTEPCADSVNDCGVANRPFITFGNTVTTPRGSTSVSASSTLITVTRPSLSAWKYTLSSGKVTSATVNGVTTNYSYVDDATTRTVTRSTPAATETFKFKLSTLQLLEYKNVSTGAITTYTYNTLNQLSQVELPEHNKITFEYDARGNAITTTQISKSPGVPVNIVTHATYNQDCTIGFICNAPLSLTDANGATTNFHYDTTSQIGKIYVTITSPAAKTGAVQRSDHLIYQRVDGSRYALTDASVCRKNASCAGTSDETKTNIAYGTYSENNFQPKVVTTSAGDGSLSISQSYTYNALGDTLTVDGPLSGTADTTTYRYDVNRELVGTISADPDGSGSLLRRATRLTYNSEGLVTKAEVGTVAGTNDSAWSAFVSKQQLTTTYDTHDRKTRDVMTAGGVTYGVTDYSYDSMGRPDCVAIRMNNATWGTATAACTAQTASSAGPDRITRNTGYDAANRVTSVTSGYGVSGTASTESTTYTANGKIATVTDGESNRTTYIYDGFDRLSKIEYPRPTKGSGSSSTSDYEQLGYDANGNITSRRLRDNTSIGYTYDALNRLTNKNLPGSELDVTYAYDLLGRPTSVSQSGNALSFTYDALGRLLTQTGPQGTLTSTWDSGGRRTKLAWGDGFYVIYDYDTLGEMTKVREKGATSGVGVLASYAYDDLGNRAGAAFGNGTTTSWTPDAVSRLHSIVHNLGGTADDLTKTFTYNAASQIRSLTSSNDAYAWNAAADVDRNYTANGLNQYTVSGSTSLSYDARGNLITSGANSYTYTSENLMKTGPGGTSVAYDPLLRLYQVTKGSSTTRFAYDGLEMIGEYNASNALQKRYVYGPGTDEPIVQYTGTGTTARAWLHADERGSVIAMTDSSGNPTAINTYDEYGIPGSTNTGRFQYTGQAWIPELGLYYYKARMYSPSLGRFMQTDPIGYHDGLNWYNYVGSDPVNFIDPTGEIHQECHLSSGGTVYTADGVFEGRTYSCSAVFDPGDFGGGRGGSIPGGHLGGGHGGKGPPSKHPSPPQTRQCTAFQQSAEKFADAAEDVAGASASVAAAAGAADLAAVQLTRRVPAIAPATVQLVAPSVRVAQAALYVGAVASGAAVLGRLASGDTIGAAITHVTNRIGDAIGGTFKFADRLAKDVGLGDIGGNEIGNSIQSALSSAVGENRCN